jgi:N-acyl-D-aspartate/D-glutamate deacylase
VRDNATYLEPATPPSGIEYVLINGQVVVEKGRLTGNVRTGQVLRRNGH